MIYSPKELKNRFEDYLAEIAIETNPGSLDIIQVGDDFASTKYISFKRKFGQKIGIVVNNHKFNLDSSIDSNYLKPQILD